MSHVVSSQPSATSPYQPTAMTETGQEKTEPTRIHGSLSDSGQDDCCISTRNRTGLGFVFCKLLSMCCQGIKNCTDNCCESCANCLNDCCEDKPRDRARNYNTRYSNYSNNYYDNNTCFNDDATWGVSDLSEQPLPMGVENALRRDDDVPTLTSHHTSCHDSHDTGDTHDSSGDTCHSGGDDGGGCDSGGGDSGGGCDDSGGGCDDGGGDCCD